MRWSVSISVILIMAGTGLLIYAATLPIYTDPDAPVRLSNQLNPTEGMKPEEENARFERWFSQLRTYETPYKRLSDLGRGLCATGLGFLVASGVWALYHRRAWMRTAWAMLLLWLLLWVVRFPLSAWYFVVRQQRFDYPVWGDSIAIGIFKDWVTWTIGALISSIVLTALLKGYRFSGAVRLRRPKSKYEWFRVILLAVWIGFLTEYVLEGIPDGDEGAVITSIVATVVLLVFISAEPIGSKDRSVPIAAH